VELIVWANVPQNLVAGTEEGANLGTDRGKDHGLKQGELCEDGLLDKGIVSLTRSDGGVGFFFREKTG